MESLSVSGFSSTEELNIPNQTPLNQPIYMSFDSDSNSNSQISYYNQVFGNSNPIQYILDNHNILLQKEKNNEANNSFVKEDKSTNLCTKVNNSFVKEDKSTNLCTNENKMPQPQIVNIVSMVNLRVPLNLKLIALKCRNSENPSRINAVIMRIKEPKATALIFNSGKIIVLGARDKEESKKAAKIFAK